MELTLEELQSRIQSQQGGQIQPQNTMQDLAPLESSTGTDLQPWQQEYYAATGNQPPAPTTPKTDLSFLDEEPSQPVTLGAEQAATLKYSDKPLEFDESAFKEMQEKGYTAQQMYAVQKERIREQKPIPKFIRNAAKFVGMEIDLPSEYIEAEIRGEGNRYLNQIKDMLTPSNVARTVATGITMGVPLAKGIPGIAKAAGTVATTQGAKRAIIELDSGNRDLKDIAQKTGKEAMWTGLGEFAMQKYGGPLVEKFTKWIGNLNVTPKVTREGFKEMSKDLFKASDDIADNFVENAKRIKNLSRQEVMDNKYLTGMASSLKNQIAAKKAVYGKSIEKQIKRIGNKVADVTDVKTYIDDIVSQTKAGKFQTGKLDNDQLQIIENLANDLSGGKLTYKQIDTLKSAINKQTATSAGKPIVNEVNAVLRDVKKKLIDKIDDSMYQAANRRFNELGDAVESAFNDPNIFKEISFRQTGQAGGRQVTKIENTLADIGREKASKGLDIINLPRKEAWAKMEKVLPQSKRFYQKALDRNTYETFFVSEGINPMEWAKTIKKVQKGIQKTGVEYIKPVGEPVFAGRKIPRKTAIYTSRYLQNRNNQ